MKYLSTLLLVVVFNTTMLANNLKANFSFCTFNTPANQPYIETYLSVVGHSVKYEKTTKNTLQGAIEITMIFKKNDEIVQFKKYNLLSPELADSLAEKVNFMDQQRITLPNGIYQFEVVIKDLNTTKPPFESKQTLIIDYPKDNISISDVELIESFKETTSNSILTKNGFDIIPYTSDFYPETFEKIAFYTEIYNANKVLGEQKDFLIACFIESYEGKQKVGNFQNYTREKAKPVNILLKSFPIQNLPSGNYNLVIEARTKTNDLLLNKKMFFQRSNPSASPLLMSTDYQSTFVSELTAAELKEYIKCIEPISTISEADFAHNQLEESEADLMRQFFYHFWTTRNNAEPETEWLNYKKEVETVNELFSTVIKKGYTTDRGRIYLKHGKPNTRSVFPSEPSAYPYEIWHYYKIDNFTNKRFVFYSRDLSTNEYPLIHSTMPGYINNSQWKIQIHRRTNTPFEPDATDNDSHYGGRASDYYNNPR